MNKITVWCETCNGNIKADETVQAAEYILICGVCKSCKKAIEERYEFTERVINET